MSQPTPYDRQTSFALFSSENPGEQQSGVSLDQEFNAVKLSLDETQSNLALIQRDDGHLANGSVGIEQFDESVSLGVRSAGVWTTATDYTANVVTVFHVTKIYRCAITHTSGDFATDLAAGYWVELADLGVQVLDVDTVGPTELQDDAVETAKIVNSAVTTPKIATAAVTTPKIADANVTLAKLATAVQSLLLPAGAIVPFGSTNIPTGWLACNGKSVLRTDYPALFATIGTFYGSADGTHFNVPNLMGRQIVCLDAMDGASAVNLVTAAGSGMDSTVLGTTGGTQTKTLTQAQLPNYTLPKTLAISDTRVFQVDGQPLGGASNPSVFAQAGGGLTISGPKTISVASGSISLTGDTQSGGSGNAHSTMDPSIVFPYLIKAH